MKHTSKQNKNFLPFVHKTIKEMENGTILNQYKKKYANTMVKRHQVTTYCLEEYEATFGKIFLKKINQKWLEELKSFLIKNNHPITNIEFTFKCIKLTLNQLYKNNLTNFNPKTIKTKRHTPINIRVYNPLDELARLLKLDLSQQPELQFVRDLYVVHCFIGLQFNNFKKMMQNIKSHITIQNGGPCFEIKIPNNTRKIIPVAKIVQKIITRNKGSLRFSFSISTYSDRIKKIAQLAGIDQTITTSLTHLGTPKKKSYPKYYLMSAESAKKSFAVNAIINGIPLSIVMFMTGNQHRRDFFDSTQYSQLKIIQKDTIHPFFKRKPINKIITHKKNHHE